MSEEYKEILICAECYHVISDYECNYQARENGIIYLCPKCKKDMIEAIVILDSYVASDVIQFLSNTEN